MALSPRFQALNLIPSPAIKSKVLEELYKIDGLINQLKTGYVEASTTNLINRYFVYLEKTCKDPPTLLRRTEWILHYTKTVRLKLALTLSLSSKKDHPYQQREDNDFTEIVETFIHLVVLLYAHQLLLPHEHALIKTCLDTLKIKASHVHPNLTSMAYLDLKEKAVLLRDEYLFLLECKLAPPNPHCLHQHVHELTGQIETILLPSSH